MSCRASIVLPSTLACGLLFALAQAEAQAVRTIRVTGSGTAAVSPNFVEVRGTLSASGAHVYRNTVYNTPLSSYRLTKNWAAPSAAFANIPPPSRDDQKTILLPSGVQSG